MARSGVSTDQESLQLFAVVDYKGEPFNIEAGLGFGLTPASDGLVAKLMISRDLNSPEDPRQRRTQ